MTVFSERHAGALARAKRASRRAKRGFTLVELLVAMSAGIMVSAAAFLLARNSTKFFQHEARISTAQFAATVGMTRLQSDLQRAGFMASPNISKDRFLCGNTTGWPTGMTLMSALNLEEGGSVVRHTTDHTLTAANGLNPDAMIITGNFGTTEHFGVQTLEGDGMGGMDVILQFDDGAMKRALASNNDTLTTIFRTGRMLRLVDKEGRHAYGVITGFTENPGGPYTVSLGNSPAFPTKATQGTCGCDKFCVGGMVSPVARYLYDLRKVDPAVYTQYTGMFSPATAPITAFHRGFTEPQRTELVRVELDKDNAEIPATLEVLSEYAVDLKFGITQSSGGVTPTLTRHAIGSAPVYTAAGVATDNASLPERIKAVTVRLSVRSSKADREVGLTFNSRLYRFNLGAGIGFARMRTLVTDVSLTNMAGVNW